MTALCLIARHCHKLMRRGSQRYSQVYLGFSPHPTSRLGARHVLGVCCQWGNCQMRAQAPAPSRAHAHPTIPGERLLKDSDSRNNKGSRIASVLIRVQTTTSTFLLYRFATPSGKISASWHLLWVNVLLQPFRD